MASLGAYSLFVVHTRKENSWVLPLAEEYQRYKALMADIHRETTTDSQHNHNQVPWEQPARILSMAHVEDDSVTMAWVTNKTTLSLIGNDDQSCDERLGADASKNTIVG